MEDDARFLHRAGVALNNGREAGWERNLSSWVGESEEVVRDWLAGKARVKPPVKRYLALLVTLKTLGVLDAYPEFRAMVVGVDQTLETGACFDFKRRSEFLAALLREDDTGGEP